MAHNVNAEIVAIGTEILLGELTDTNSVFIARLLRDLGVNVYFMTSVGDNKGRIAEAIRIALSRAQVVITCGGLGPTVDDMTRDAIAVATDRELVFHKELLDEIAARFETFKVKMTENNRQQAYLPENAMVIENPVGTAPSFVVEHGDGIVISLPGVPREMKFLMTERVVPMLRERYELGIIKARILKAAGIGESSLDDMIGRAILEGSNPTVGLAAHHGQIDIRITAKADTESQADIMIAETEARIRELVGHYIFGVDEEMLEGVLVGLLQRVDAKIAIVQAGLGELLTGALQRVPDNESVITVSETFATPEEARIAHKIANVLPLREASQQIARQVSEISKAQIVLVVMGQPGVDEASDSEESTVVTVYSADEVRDRVYGFGGKSEIARDWLPRWALSTAWRMLRDRTGLEADAN